jgi:hypothetical protein
MNAIATVLALALCGSGVGCASPSGLGPDAGPVDSSAAETGAKTPIKGSTGVTGALAPPSMNQGSCTSSSTDEQGCGCAAGQTHACYTGPASTRGVGICHDGTQTCQAQGEFNGFGPCLGQVVSTSLAGCTPTHDAGIPVPEAGPPVVVVVAPTPAEAGAEIAVGSSCTPGDVQALPDAGGGSFAGGGQGQVYYCDSSGVWDTFPDGACSPTACLSCLQTNCAAAVMSSTPACPGLQQAYTWLAGCGPDRSAYFQSLGAACPDAVIALQECKDSSCYDTSGGPCSVY